MFNVVLDHLDQFKDKSWKSTDHKIKLLATMITSITHSKSVILLAWCSGTSNPQATHE